MSTSLTYRSAEDKRIFFFSETGHSELDGSGTQSFPAAKGIFFPLRVFVVVVWFFTPESKGQTSGFSRGKGWNSRLNRRTAELFPKDAVFQGAFICKSFFTLSVNKTEGGREINFFNCRNKPDSSEKGNVMRTGLVAGLFPFIKNTFRQATKMDG